MKNKNKKTEMPYIPRVVCKMNTGTRVIRSKKDKACSRQRLNLDVQNAW